MTLAAAAEREVAVPLEVENIRHAIPIAVGSRNRHRQRPVLIYTERVRSKIV